MTERTSQSRSPIPFFTADVRDYVRALDAPLESGQFGPGPMVERFNKFLAAHIGVKHAQATNSGTTALYLAALASGLPAGTEVICPAYGPPATVNAMRLAGWRVRLADIDAFGCITPETILQAATTETRAVCYVNFSGLTDANIHSVRDLCWSRDWFLIEDAAAAIGHVSGSNKRAGSFGHVGILSFSALKLVTTGQGGAVLSNDDAVMERVRALCDQGDPYRLGRCVSVGGNFRLTDLQAALGLAQLKRLAWLVQRRQEQHTFLQESLWQPSGQPSLYVTGPSGPMYHNLLLLPLSASPSTGSQLVQQLNTYGIEARRQYAVICDHPAHSDLKPKNYQLLTASRRDQRSVYLPFGLGLSIRQLQHLVSVLNRLLPELIDG